MPRVLTFQLKDLKVQVTLQKFSRDTLYGKGSREKRGEEGQTYSNALLTQDGAHIIPYSGIGAHYIDPKGNFLETTLLVDAEGNAVPITRSMFKKPVQLTRALSFNDLYSYNIERTYLLKSEDKSSLKRLYKICELLLKQDKLYRFTYAYYDTTNPRDAILIPKKGNLIMLVGEYVELIMLKPTEFLYSDIEEEELEEEITFEIW